MSDTPDEKMADEPIGDDVIMAYADGVLAPDQRSAVRDALARDPALMQRFESFLFTRGPLARAFDAVLAAPIPERLLEAVREPAPARIWPKASLLGSVHLARLAGIFRVPDFSPAVAIPAVLVGAAAGWLAHYALPSDYVPLENRGFVAWTSLQQALEQTPRGSSASLVEGLTFKPTLTFASLQQTWCRQYELSYGAALRSGGLACRRRDGVWRVIALTEPEPPPATADPGKIEPAGKDDVLDATRAQIKGGDVLGRGEEERLIKEHWPTKPVNLIVP
jgi:hypothetical protein